MKPGSIPKFQGYVPASRDFDAARTGFYTPFKLLDQLDLSVAPPAGGKWYDAEGDFLYVDLDPVNSNGNVTIEFSKRQDAEEGAIYLVPGLGIQTLFKGVKVNWSVQAGKKTRLLYSTGDRVIPSSPAVQITGVVTVNGQTLVASVAPVLSEEIGFAYGATYKSNTGMAANTSDTVLAVASNVNGARVWSANGHSGNATNFTVLTLAAATAAPNSTTVGDVLASNEVAAFIAANFNIFANLRRPVFVASGKGLFWTSGIAETLAFRSVPYTLF
jgi:hypothetical protein